MEKTVDSFMEKLQSMSLSSQKKKSVVNRKLIEKMFCNFKGNFGKYQILPFNNVVTDFPFVTLKNTREINIPRRNLAADGTETVYNAWIRLLPENAYTVKDPSSGREVSSLTEAEESLLHQAYNIFEELYKEVDARNNVMDPTIGGLIRRKNYTLFHGYCINKWEGDSRNPVRSNFSALFIVTAKNFTELVNNSIADTNIMAGRNDWTTDIYNRDLKNRKGFFMFSISKADGPGFNINVNHTLNAENYLSGVTIPEEDANLMENPVETFLGWQANRLEEGDVPSDQRRLFNKNLITEAIEYMTEQLAKVRMAKQNGTNIQEAIKATNEMVVKNQNPTNTRGASTNDPILADMAHQAAQEQSVNSGMASNPETIVARNDAPFQTPPAAKLDPITGAPTGGAVTETMSNYTEPKTEEKNPFNPGFGGMNFGGFNNGGNKPF